MGDNNSSFFLAVSQDLPAAIYLHCSYHLGCLELNNITGDTKLKLNLKYLCLICFILSLICSSTAGPGYVACKAGSLFALHGFWVVMSDKESVVPVATHHWILDILYIFIVSFCCFAKLSFSVLDAVNSSCCKFNFSVIDFLLHEWFTVYLSIC